MGKPKRPRPRTRRYSATLLTPIVVPDPFRRQRHFKPDGPFFWGLAAKAAEAAKLARERGKKLPALFAHFGISAADADRWERLATALAIEHVPGFSFVRAQGAPVVASVALLSNLYRRFIGERAKRARGLSRRRNNRDVCQALLKDSDFKTSFPTLADVGLKRLQNLVSEARARRKARVKAVLQRAAYAYRLRRAGGDPSDQDAILFGDLPLWISEGPNNMFVKYFASQRYPEKGGGNS